MTQADFARAAGWSASTISSWERGTSKPSRIAFKTILAFAEERGVRYQPKSEGVASAAQPGNETLPVLRLSSRLEPPVEVLDAGRASSPLGREESFGSRRWTDIAASRPAAAYAGQAVPLAERPEWQVDARLQIRIGTGTARWGRTGYVAASVVALAIGISAGILIRTGLRADAAPSRVASAPLEPAPPVDPGTAPVHPAPAVAAPAPHVEVNELALAGLAAPPFAAAPAEIPAEPAVASMRPMPPPSFARLESIVALDGIRRATFRVGDRSIALVEGDELGGRSVAAIAHHDVMLAGGGIQRRVRLGSEIPLE